MHLRPGWLFAVAGFAVAACSGGGSSGPNITGPHVVISDFTFTPQSITIKVGQSVTWTNSGPSVHDVTSDTMVFESGNMGVGSEGNPYGGSTQGGVFSFAFNTAGTYNYHCMLHPPSVYPSFTGTVVVTP
jgi:plastocyanin